MSILSQDPFMPGLHLTNDLEGQCGSQGHSKQAAEPRLKPDFIPIPGATAFLTFPTLTRDRVYCHVISSSVTDTLDPPCLPIPSLSLRLPTPPFCTHAHAYVGPRALEWLAQVSLSWVLCCVDTLVHPAAQPPAPDSDLSSLEMKGTGQT